MAIYFIEGASWEYVRVWHVVIQTLDLGNGVNSKQIHNEIGNGIIML
jgi:hypothetical protein